MLTFFTTAKAFEGHSGVIQRNALTNWTLLHPDAEVILFGDDKGAAEIAGELGLRHVPSVERNEFGTKRLDSMFRQAQSLARHDVLCYINCDILLLPEFILALQRVQQAHDRFLMVGRRWDTDITEPLAFSNPGWRDALRQAALQHGAMQPGHTIDYFVFRRGLYKEMPALVIGRIWWDHWLVWKARQERADVVDVTSAAICVHQNHNYGYHPSGVKGVHTDAQAKRNLELAGNGKHLLTIDDATHILGRTRERVNWGRFWAPTWRVLRPKVVPFWFAFLRVTRPLRKVLGLRRAVPARVSDPASR